MNGTISGYLIDAVTGEITSSSELSLTRDGALGGRSLDRIKQARGEDTTSSSDGQRFRASGGGEQSGQVNLRYGNEPGVLLYTHSSAQYTPFYTKVIAANARDATHVLDGLLLP
jgi:hypothetical protein